MSDTVLNDRQLRFSLAFRAVAPHGTNSSYVTISLSTSSSSNQWAMLLHTPPFRLERLISDQLRSIHGESLTSCGGHVFKTDFESNEGRRVARSTPSRFRMRIRSWSVMEEGSHSCEPLAASVLVVWTLVPLCRWMLPDVQCRC